MDADSGRGASRFAPFTSRQSGGREKNIAKPTMWSKFRALMFLVAVNHCLPSRRLRAVVGLAIVAFLTVLGTASAQNLAQNPGFESGTTGWSGWGGVSFTSSTALPRTGFRSALVQNRTATWNGVAQNVVGVLQPTNTYRMAIRPHVTKVFLGPILPPCPTPDQPV